MSLGHDNSAWLEDNLLVPRAGRIWPWVLATCLLATALIVAIIVAYNRG